MNPQQAAKLGVKSEDVAIESWARKYGGYWILHVPALADPERGLAILTSTSDIYEACQWKAILKRITDGS